LVLKPKFFKTSRPTKAKTKTSKNGLKTKTGLKHCSQGRNQGEGAKGAEAPLLARSTL